MDKCQSVAVYPLRSSAPTCDGRFLLNHVHSGRFLLHWTPRFFLYAICSFLTRTSRYPTTPAQVTQAIVLAHAQLTPTLREAKISSLAKSNRKLELEVMEEGALPSRAGL